MMERKFGNYTISFKKGTKLQGDYVILINGKQIKDDYIFETIHKYTFSIEKAIEMLCKIWNLSNIQEKEIVYKEINEMDYTDNIKVVLYAIWHRLIIDDINYPIEKGLNGRRRLLGQIYLLLAKKFGFALPKFILSIPEEVFKLGFPNGLTEKVTTQQWNEIYEIFEKFMKGCQK